jgi:hypothetical protein
MISSTTRFVVLFAAMAGAAVLLSGCAVLRVKDPCRCLPLYHWLQYRYAAKNDTASIRYPRAADTIDVAGVIRWQSAYPIDREPINPMTRRLPGTPEDTMYVLRGRLHYAAQMLDCDYHMEIGPMDSLDTRHVVCEIPVKYCYLQRWVTRRIEARGYAMRRAIPGGIPVILTGVGFFDGQHGLKRSSHKASQWELHPVNEIRFLDEGAEIRN